MSDLPANTFRPIYYLGCKTEFAAAIKAAIEDVSPRGRRLGDLFAGTGAVGAALGATREVTTVDVQEYSRVLCSAVLQPSALKTSEISRRVTGIESSENFRRMRRCVEHLIHYERQSIDHALRGEADELVCLLESKPLAVRDLEGTAVSSKLDELSSEAIANLKKHGLWESPDSTVLKFFGGLYFSFEQAVSLDAVLAHAHTSEPTVRDTLIAAALSTASMLVNTVGKQFAQPIRPMTKAGVVKTSLAAVVQKDRSMDALRTYELWLGKFSRLRPAIGQSIAIRQDYLEAIDENAQSWSVIYADPPYTRDHYSRFYHVLETMCLRDNPLLSQVKKKGKVEVSRGLYREERHQSDFCIRSRAPAAFDALFNKARTYDLPLVLSYSPHETGDGTHPRVVSMEQIVDIANAHYERVEIAAIDGSTHNLLNRSGLKLRTREHAEILLKCYV